MNNYQYRIELSFDKKNTPTLSLRNLSTKEIEDQDIGIEAYRNIEDMAKEFELQKIYYNESKDYIRLIYDDPRFYIVIKHPDAITGKNSKSMPHLINQIKKCVDNNQIVIVEPPKVTRENKYHNSKINWTPATKRICLLLAGLMSVTLLITLNGKLEAKNFPKNNEPTPAVEIFEPQEPTVPIWISPNQPSDSTSISTAETSSTTISSNEESPAIACFDYRDNTSNKKAVDCRNNYYELICKYCRMYGVDPNLILAIATQERGYHSETPDKYATGLMQISYKAVAGTDKNGKVLPTASVKCYNFETGKMETETFTANSICQLEENIKVGVMLFRFNYDNYSKHNILLAVQTYNSGCGRVNGIIQNHYLYNYLDKEDNENSRYTYNEFTEKCQDFLCKINNYSNINNVNIKEIINSIGIKDNDIYNYEDLKKACIKIIYADQENTTWIDKDLLSGYNGSLYKSCDDPLYMEHVFQYFLTGINKITMFERAKDENGNYINSTYSDNNYVENSINIYSTSELENIKSIKR